MAAFGYVSRDSEVCIFFSSMMYLPVYSSTQLADPQKSGSLPISPTFANGTSIPNGDYRILVRALRVTGNPANEDDYESWLSPIFGVQVPLYHNKTSMT